MDIAVCVVDFDKNILWYAGANNPLYLVRGGELIHYRADKMPVSIHYRMQPFTLHKIDFRKEMHFIFFLMVMLISLEVQNRKNSCQCS